LAVHVASYARLPQNAAAELVPPSDEIFFIRLITAAWRPIFDDRAQVRNKGAP
jgi:hypothetical protein